MEVTIGVSLARLYLAEEHEGAAAHQNTAAREPGKLTFEGTSIRSSWWSCAGVLARVTRLPSNPRLAYLEGGCTRRSISPQARTHKRASGGADLYDANLHLGRLYSNRGAS